MQHDGSHFVTRSGHQLRIAAHSNSQGAAHATRTSLIQKMHVQRYFGAALEQCTHEDTARHNP
jgi:hypothetical protein